MARTREESRRFKEEIIEMAEEGAPVRVIADELDTSLPYIYQILKAAGVTPTSPLRSTSPLEEVDSEQAHALFKAYVEGEQISGLIARYGMTHHDFYRLCAREGFPLRENMSKRRETFEQRIQKAVELYETGFRVKKIHELTGVSPQQMYAAIKGKKSKQVRAMSGALISANLANPNPDPWGLDDGELFIEGDVRPDVTG